MRRGHGIIAWLAAGLSSLFGCSQYVDWTDQPLALGAQDSRTVERPCCPDDPISISDVDPLDPSVLDAHSPGDLLTVVGVGVGHGVVEMRNRYDELLAVHLEVRTAVRSELSIGGIELGLDELEGALFLAGSTVMPQYQLYDQDSALLAGTFESPFRIRTSASESGADEGVVTVPADVGPAQLQSLLHDHVFNVELVDARAIDAVRLCDSFSLQHQDSEPLCLKPWSRGQPIHGENAARQFDVRAQTLTPETCMTVPGEHVAVELVGLELGPCRFEVAVPDAGWEKGLVQKFEVEVRPPPSGC